MSTINPHSEYPPVIVRAFGDEPVRLFAYRLNLQSSTVYVGNEAATRPVGFPLDDVFDFDAELYRALNAAYSTGNKAALSDLYESIRRKNAGCNRYQDALRYAHEEKAQVPNTRSST
jgi:hypothetical protein